MLRLTQWLSRKTTTIHNPFSYFYLLWGLYTFNCLKPHNTMFGFTTEIGLCLVPTNDGCTLTLTKKILSLQRALRRMMAPGTGEFPAQMASDAENASIWWRHHICQGGWLTFYGSNQIPMRCIWQTAAYGDARVPDENCPIIMQG